MARKKAQDTEKTDMPAVEQKLRMVRLELPEDFHKLLRLEAAKRDISLAALAREAVEAYLTRAGKASGR